MAKRHYNWPYEGEPREGRGERARDERYGARDDDDERGPEAERYGPISSGRRDYSSRPDVDEDEVGEGGYYRGYYRAAATPLDWRGGTGSLITESWMITGPHTGKGPKGYRRSTEQIVEEASERLNRSGHIDASNIDVSCEDGVLTLRGTVEDRRTKRAAEECVESIFGVEDVANELRVQRRQSQEQEEPAERASRRSKTA